MSAGNDSFAKTIFVAVALCLVCSLLVSGAAVGLKDIQQTNKVADIRRSILAAGGLMEDGKDLNELFNEKIETVVVDFSTGELVTDLEVEKFDQRQAAKDPTQNKVLSKAEDIASIKRRAKFGKAYLVKSGSKVEAIILPVHGYGLYSTLYGFLALKPDTTTVIGIKFYEQNETPGLGGEVVNPKWVAQWPGKEVYNEQFEPALKLVKTGATTANEVDALTGATMTSRGVENLLAYWLGDDGFGPFLAKFRGGHLGQLAVHSGDKHSTGGSHGI